MLTPLSLVIIVCLIFPGLVYVRVHIIHIITKTGFIIVYVLHIPVAVVTRHPPRHDTENMCFFLSSLHANFVRYSSGRGAVGSSAATHHD